jgi:hypothetical protein
MAHLRPTQLGLPSVDVRRGNAVATSIVSDQFSQDCGETATLCPGSPAG